MQGPFLVIFAMELGERNATKTCTQKEWSEQFVILRALFKNGLKHVFVLTACVCASTLPNADENAARSVGITCAWTGRQVADF